MTHMNDFLTLKTEHLFPVVMALFELTTLSYIAYAGIALIALGLFPVVCWLAGLTSPFVFGLTLLFSPILILLSPLIIVGAMFASTVLALLGGGLPVGAFITVVVLYLFCVFMAIFGEIILIPWFFLAIIPSGFGVILVITSQYILPLF